MRAARNKKHQKQHQPSACIVDETLILTLPNASTPTVWRMELETVTAAAFQVVQDEEEGGYNLVMTSSDDHPRSIANFNAHETAVEALLAASGAMQNAQYTTPATYPASYDPQQAVPQQAVPAMQSQQTTGTSPSGRGRGRGLVMAAGVVLIVILLYMIANIGPQRVAMDGRATTNAGQKGTPGGEGQSPMSAEQFFQQQQ